MTTITRTLRISSLFTLLLVLSSLASAIPLESEKFIKMFTPNFASGDLSQIKSAADTLAYAGVSSPQLYDVAEKRLLEVYNDGSKQGIQVSGWLIKAISYSGNKKYEATFQKIIADSSVKKVRRYAEGAMETLEEYARWNPEISAGLGNLTGKAAEKKRIQNMLASKQFDLLRLGAKRTYNGYTNDMALLKQVEKRLLEHYQGTGDKVFVDTMAWLCKALAGSADPAFKPTMEKVANGAGERKVQKYAARYLKKNF